MMNKYFKIKKIFDSKMLIVTFFFIGIFSCISAMANDVNYYAYAKEQEERAKKLIVPYEAEISGIINKIPKRQTQSDIQNFKQKKMTRCIAKNNSTELAATATYETFSTPILVFISFSMPKESIRGWISQTRKANAAIYIRGLVNNSFKDTIISVKKLVEDQPGGLLIDPTLFKKYSITQVPAVVVTSENDFDVVYGDVTLDYALKKISQIRPKNNFLLDTINKLHKKSSN
jgi:type-F conjugative transfer system pilin assembly protein TrbC